MTNSAKNTTHTNFTLTMDDLRRYSEKFMDAKIKAH